MNSDIFAGKWKQLRGKVKETWGRLTDDDLDAVEGKFERLVGMIQERYGYERDRAEREIEAALSEPAKLKTSSLALFLVLLLSALIAITACGPTKDATLTAELKTRFAADSTVRAGDITVETNHGVVTLTGNIDRQEEKDRAIQIARETRGVVDVVDMIAVRTSEMTGDAPSPPRTLGERIDDATITADVKARLLEDPQVKGLSIDVDTRDGVVYLTGKVASSTERDRAVSLARDTKHVKEVQSNLVVSRV